MALQGKKILIGITGGIAAYKSAILVRLLIKAGAEVQVVLTPDAAQFVTPLTLATLSGKPVFTTLFDEKTGEWNNHVKLALWADIVVVAPTTANTIAKFANGLCDNLLAAIYLSARSPVFVAPAMDLDMWRHPATQNNVRTLKTYGNTILPPGDGPLASGLSGEGRMAEPEDIFDCIVAHFSLENQPLFGKKALVTAGPTYEAIDPVRFIGNHSSGKMGLAIAKRLQQLGAEVKLVHGPISEPLPKGMTTVSVRSAAEMLDACLANFDDTDITVMSAAVADYTPKDPADRKIKKEASVFAIELTKTVDILATLGAKKKENQLLVGFALETHDEQYHATDKLVRKNLDFIVLNSLNDPGAGFAGDSNKVTIIEREGQVYPFPLKTKDEVANDIISHILSRLSLA